MTRVGIIGAGYWGPNLIRNFSDNPNVQLSAICDLDPKRLEPFARRFPDITITTRFAELLLDPTIDALAIATPIASHFELAKAALENGKHVFVEKPLTRTLAEAKILVELAQKQNLLLMVDHVFLYTPAVRKMKALIDSGELGDLLYFDSVRVNLGLFQNDVNVVWDLATHDLAIMDYLLERPLLAVQAVGAKHAHETQENIAYIHCFFEDDVVAHFHVNWLAPVKIRQILIGGTRKMIVYNDIEPSEKVRVYDKGVDIQKNDALEGRTKTLISYRTGDVLIPKLEPVEALSLACQDFIARIESGEHYFSCDGAHGAKVVALLEAIDHSLKTGGQRVSLTLPSIAALGNQL